MNIFYLSRDPVQCAQWHLDKHVHQMIREYAQLLCFAHRLLDGTPVEVENARGYGRTRTEWQLANPEHEREFYHVGRLRDNICTQWILQGTGNYAWLYRLFAATSEEYTWRYHSVHDTWQRLGESLVEPPFNAPRVGWTQPGQAMHPRFQVLGSALQAYRECYRWGKNPIAVWTGRDPPPWYMVPGMEIVELRAGKTGQRRVRVVNPAIEFERTPRGKTRGIKPDDYPTI